jgi:hypothetical protein
MHVVCCAAGRPRQHPSTPVPSIWCAGCATSAALGGRPRWTGVVTVDGWMRSAAPTGFGVVRPMTCPQPHPRVCLPCRPYTNALSTGRTLHAGASLRTLISPCTHDCMHRTAHERGPKKHHASASRACSQSPVRFAQSHRDRSLLRRADKSAPVLARQTKWTLSSMAPGCGMTALMALVPVRANRAKRSPFDQANGQPTRWFSHFVHRQVLPPRPRSPHGER